MLPLSTFLVCLALATYYQFVHVGFRRLTVTAMLLASLVLVHGLPMLVYQHFTGPDTFVFESALGGMDRDDVLGKVLLALSAMFCCLMLGIALANATLTHWRREGALAERQAIASPGGLSRVYRATVLTRSLILLVALGMLAVILVDDQFAKIVEYFSLDGLEVEKILLRRESGGIDNYLYNVTLYSIAPFLCTVAIVLAARPSGRAVDTMFAVGLLLVVLIGKLGTLSKAPPVVFILQLLLLWFLLRGKRLNLRTASLAAVAVVVLFGAMVRAVIPELDIGATLAFLYYRIFDIPNEALIEYFAAYPTSIPHGYGASLFASLGDAPPRLPSYFAVAALVRDDSLYASSSNTLFIGDAWAEFAWPGVVCVSILAGYWTRAIDLYAYRRGRTDEAACLVAACSFGVFTMLSTSFTTALVTGGLALVPLLSGVFLRKARARRRMVRAQEAAA